MSPRILQKLPLPKKKQQDGKNVGEENESNRLSRFLLHQETDSSSNSH